MIGGVNNIRRRVEAAVAQYLTLQSDPGAGVNVYRWLDAAGDGDRLAYPCLIVHAKSGRPMSADLDATSGSTNRYVSVVVRVMSPGAALSDTATAREAHDELVGRVMDCLHVDGLPAELNDAAPGGVAFEQVDLPVDEDMMDDGLVATEITFDVLAHGTEA